MTEGNPVNNLERILQNNSSMILNVNIWIVRVQVFVEQNGIMQLFGLVVA